MTVPISQYNIAAFSAGDLDTLNKLYQHFYKTLVFYGVKLTNNTQQSEDIVITAFAKLWEKRADFNNLASIQSFLYTIVKNESFKFYHHEKVKQRHEAGIILHVNNSNTNEFAESKLVLTDLIAQLYKEVDQLPEKYKTIIHHLYLKEHSVDETCTQLNISPANFRKRKQRALHMLKNQLIKKELQEVLIILSFLSQNSN